MANVSRALASLALFCTLTGCSTAWRPITDGTIGSVPAKALVADYRLATVQTNPKDLEAGKHNPVMCAEPSPDIARAFSSALSASLSGGYSRAAADGSTRNADVAAALQYQTSQTIAQLGKRYATVQILRDILHDQCMQYANGTMSESTWAIMQSRFNSLVVTLLAIEMASGDTAPAPINVSAKVGSDDKPADGGDTKGGDDGAAAKATAPTVQQFTAVSAAVDDAKAQYNSFSGAVTKLAAAEKAAAAAAAASAASAPAASASAAAADAGADKATTKPAAKAFQAALTQLKKAHDTMIAAWKGVTIDKGTPSAETKDKIAAFTKAVPTKDDKTVADAASSAASSPAAKESKAASEALTKAIAGLTAANTKLSALAAAESATTAKPTNPVKADAASSKNLTEAQVNAVAAIHANFTQREDLGPSLLGCFTLLDPPGPGAEVASRQISPLLAAYCQAALQARIDASKKLIDKGDGSDVASALKEQNETNWLTQKIKPSDPLARKLQELIKQNKELDIH